MTAQVSKWSLKGSYFETCNCEVECPCIFMSAPSHGDCTVLVAWHIDEGNFDKLNNLGGLNVVGIFHSPGNMFTTKWRVALYIDDKASKEQSDALTKIFAGQAGGAPAALASFVGEVAGVKKVKIEYSATGKNRSVKIPQIAEAEIEAIEGQGGSTVSIQNHPVAVSPGQVATVAKSTAFRAHDLGFEIELSNKSGLYAPFKYDNE
jgi:hypothetical protein